jgi:hypothetical protein
MEKYGVEENAKPGDKQASDQVTHCPWCGAKLIRHGSTVLCPKHGSQPFEQHE